MNKIFLIATVLLLSCKNEIKQHQHPEQKVEVKTYRKLLSFQTLQVGRFKVDILNPEEPVLYNLVVLPGWNFEKEKWCHESDLCKKATQAGFRLIMPEMGKSIYASQYFKETWPMIQQTAQIQWVIDTLFNYLQDTFGLMLPNQKNYIMGLSTGAHGTALIVERCPTLFKACAVLSGDYDQSKLTQDQIFNATYGTYNQFPDRWKTIDNPVFLIDSLNIPIYIGHGQSDPIIPVSQSQWLYKNLKEKHPTQVVRLSLKKNQKHDFTYWASEVDSILNFFIQNNH